MISSAPPPERGWRVTARMPQTPAPTGQPRRAVSHPSDDRHPGFAAATFGGRIRIHRTCAAGSPLKCVCRTSVPALRLIGGAPNSSRSTGNRVLIHAPRGGSSSGPARGWGWPAVAQLTGIPAVASGQAHGQSQPFVAALGPIWRIVEDQEHLHATSVCRVWAAGQCRSALADRDLGAFWPTRSGTFDQAGTERGPAVDPVITRVTRATPPSQPRRCRAA